MQSDISIQDVVIMVRNFFIMEKENNGPVIPFDNVEARVAAATGFSIQTIDIYINSTKSWEGNRTNNDEVNKEKINRDNIIIDAIGQDVMRKKILECTLNKERPTVRKLHNALKEVIGFQGSLEQVKQHVQKMGFRLEGTDIIERMVLVELNESEQTESYNTEYLAANLQAIPLNLTTTPLNHGPNLKMDYQLQNIGVKRKPSITGNDDEGTQCRNDLDNSMIIVVAEGMSPNATDSLLFQKIPKTVNTNSRKKDIINWLASHNVSCNPDKTRSQLLQIVYQFRAENK